MGVDANPKAMPSGQNGITFARVRPSGAPRVGRVCGSRGSIGAKRTPKTRSHAIDPDGMQQKRVLHNGARTPAGDNDETFGII